MTVPNAPDLDTLWDYENPAETEQRFRALLPNIEAEQTADIVLQIHTQIARAQGLQKQLSAAQATLDYVQQALTEATPIATLRYLLERGRLYNSSGLATEACQCFQEAYREATAQKAAFYAIDALHMLAIADAPDARLGWNQQALHLAEHTQDPRAANWQGSLLNNLGWTYFEQGAYEQALDNFTRAVAFREGQGKLRETLIARWCVARTLRALGQYAEALERQYDLRTAWLAAGLEPDGYGTAEIAECLWALGRVDEAQSYFASAYERFMRTGSLADQPERLERMKRLGKVE